MVKEDAEYHNHADVADDSQSALLSGVKNAKAQSKASAITEDIVDREEMVRLISKWLWEKGYR